MPPEPPPGGIRPSQDERGAAVILLPTTEVRVASLTLEDIGHGYHVKLHVEPWTRNRRKRELLVLIDRWNLHRPEPVRGRDAVDELLAEAVLQRRIPGIG